MAKNVSIDWVKHPKLDWEYVTVMSKKIGELLWPTLQPFTQTKELCLICCSPFGPKGAWILSTFQHMYHPQCLITLMVAKKRCPQCRAPFHWHLYKQFSFWAAMPQHWEYIMFNIPNRPQAWGANMKWIWNVNMSIKLYGGVNMMNGNMMNPWFKRHVNCCTHQQPIHNAVKFIKCFEGGITQEPTSLNTV
jgi:hypothetical protein